MKKNYRGFSLVEVMVGMVIGLLGLLVIAQVLSISQDSNRTTMSGGDAQQNAALALMAMERDIRQAGYGTNKTMEFAGCAVKGYDNVHARSIAFSFVPVLITQGTGTNPDQIQVNYGSASMVNVPVALIASMTGPSSNFRVANRFGFNGPNASKNIQGDVLLIAEAGKPCALSQVTATPSAPSNAIEHTGSGRYNPTGGLSPPADFTYSANAKLFNLGARPVSNQLRVVEGGLQVFSEFGENVPELLADGIVDMQAEYGVNTDLSNPLVVGKYTKDTPVSSPEWALVLAVRVGVVARSQKRDASEVTQNIPSWAGGSFAHVATLPDWKHYRYRVFETTVVLRNMLWKS
ncbi:PilW family protein [Methylobacillus gramineus]|uniref:PilW family protein n=1 Tax=Methylobacillus gramineus TaxID=755169 RepID=UPI001CFFF010|nr:PilW family protein [Methylobacillus gramineus]MCB5185942.1 PilW family protein [Methylobacillus gramineus]